MITVENNSDDTIRVAINHWDTDGSSDYFGITPGSSENWTRSDNSDNGFVMSLVRNNGTEHPFYIRNNNSILVEHNHVYEKLNDQSKTEVQPIV
jgi:hypothetical protein